MNGRTGKVYLFVMFTLTPACFHENETLSTCDIFIAQGTALSMLDGQVISGTINEFKCGKNFRKLPLDGLIEGEDILEGRKS